MLVYKKNKSAVYLYVIPVMKCGCVFWEFAERKLATRQDKKKIKIIKSLLLALSVVRRDARCLLATKLFNKPLLAILNGTSNPIGLHNEH
jgi:hypothetical protein